MARRGRKPKSKEQKAKDAIDRTAPPEHVARRRSLFVGLVRTENEKRLDGRQGETDSAVCDAIGQFHVLGLLDGHGYNSLDLRDRGREWRNLYVRLMRERTAKAGAVDEQVDTFKDWHRHVAGADALDPWERERFDKLDSALESQYERQVLMSLLVDAEIGSWPDGQDTAPWAQSLIDEALLTRGRIPRAMVFPTMNDRELLNAAIRGLCVLTEGSLRPRWERAA